MTPEKRMVAVRALKPELASINMGSINFGLFPMMARVKAYRYDWEQPYLESSKDLVFKNTFSDQECIFKIMEECGTKPELGTVGVIMGGFVRVGLEDNLYLATGELAKSNADLVAKMRRIITELSFDIADPAEARQMLGLKGKEQTGF